MKYRKATDKNQVEIVRDLRKAGVYVALFASTGGGVPDILAVKTDPVWIELKVEKNAKVKVSQMWWMSAYPGFVGFATTFDEAFALATDPKAHSLTKRQKERLQQLAMQDKVMHFETVKKELNA